MDTVQDHDTTSTDAFLRLILRKTEYAQRALHNGDQAGAIACLNTVLRLADMLRSELRDELSFQAAG